MRLKILVYDNFFKNILTKTYDIPNLEIYIDKLLRQLPLRADIIIKIPNDLVNLCEFYIIFINEIEINEDNLLLLFCSSIETLKRTIKTIIEKRIQFPENTDKMLK